MVSIISSILVCNRGAIVVQAYTRVVCGLSSGTHQGHMWV